MGRPVVHFEVMAKDADAIRSFYAELFDWKIDADNPLNYGMVSPDDNPPGGAGTSGIAGGIGQMPTATTGTRPSTSTWTTSRKHSGGPSSSAAADSWAPRP